MKCPRCRHGFTCYPPGVYPRRQFQLDVVASAVAVVVVGDKSITDAARAFSTSGTSVRRWASWIAALAEADALHALAAKMDPSGATVAMSTQCSHAAAVLQAFEVLGAALVRVGVAVAERTGLGRVLGWQQRAHGDVYGLTAGTRRFSPAMVRGGARRDR